MVVFESQLGGMVHRVDEWDRLLSCSCRTECAVLVGCRQMRRAQGKCGYCSSTTNHYANCNRPAQDIESAVTSAAPLFSTSQLQLLGQAPSPTATTTSSADMKEERRLDLAERMQKLEVEDDYKIVVEDEEAARRAQRFSRLEVD